MLQLVQSIPDGSALRWCFDPDVYLRAALEALLESEAIGAAAPYGPHGLKLFRCSPGNPIWLRPNLNPENLPDATPAQRNEVMKYIDKVRQWRRPGPDKGDTSMPPDLLDRIREVYTTLTNAPDASSSMITAENIIHAMKGIHPSRSTFGRWLKTLTGKTWKAFKKSL